MNTGLFLTNGQWRPYPQGYQLGDHMYCPEHIIGAYYQRPELEFFKGQVEELLEDLAKRSGINYSDQYSYDSDDFPKIIPDTDEENHCATCGVDLREV